MNIYRLSVIINYSYAFIASPPLYRHTFPIKRYTPLRYSIDEFIDDLEKIAGNIAVGAESVLDELAGIDKQKQLEGKLIPIPVPVENDFPPKQ
tara:strand:- start:1775 stop:2053 length:279 start_codon:yes stop_codon:yes gene_type:complete